MTGHGAAGRGAALAAIAAVVVVLAGCGSAANPPAPAPVSTAASAPAPAPVSTAASLTGKCVMGYQLVTGSSSGTFALGAAPPGDVNGDGSTPDPALAYQVTLTNNSGATASVSGFGVAFYDASGAEDGSDQEQASGLITPGQSLNWVFEQDQTIHGYGTGQQNNQTGAIPAGAATCQFLEWS